MWRTRLKTGVEGEWQSDITCGTTDNIDTYKGYKRRKKLKAKEVYPFIPPQFYELGEFRGRYWFNNGACEYTRISVGG